MADDGSASTGPGGAYIKGKREYPALPSSPRPNLSNRLKVGSISPLSPPMAMPFDLVKANIRILLDRPPESMDSNEEQEGEINDADKEFLRVEERSWAELPRDVLLVIFKKITAVEILKSAQFVCRPWQQLSYEPDIWRRIEILDQSVDLTVLESMAMMALDRSEGCLEEFYADSCVGDELIGYIADRGATRLRCLGLISMDDISDITLVEAVRKFPLLEELEISFCSFSDEAVELVCQACPQLKSFIFHKQSYDFLDDYFDRDTVALAIAKHMQQLRHLKIVGNRLTNIGLFAILDNCPYLEYLDIRKCLKVDLDENLKKKCARIKGLRLPNDSTVDYELFELLRLI